MQYCTYCTETVVLWSFPRWHVHSDMYRTPFKQTEREREVRQDVNVPLHCRLGSYEGRRYDGMDRDAPRHTSQTHHRCGLPVMPYPPAQQQTASIYPRVAIGIVGMYVVLRLQKAILHWRKLGLSIASERGSARLPRPRTVMRIALSSCRRSCTLVETKHSDNKARDVTHVHAKQYERPSTIVYSVAGVSSLRPGLKRIPCCIDTTQGLEQVTCPILAHAMTKFYNAHATNDPASSCIVLSTRIISRVLLIPQTHALH